MTETGEGLARLTVAQLLNAYAALGPGDETERGRRVFAERLAALRRHLGVREFAAILIDALEEKTVAPAAHLVHARQWVDQRYVDAFHARRRDDDPLWGCAVRRLLRIAATPDRFEPLAKPFARLRPPTDGDPRSMRRHRAALAAWRTLNLEWGEREPTDRPIVPSAARAFQASLANASLYGSLADVDDAMALLLSLGGLGDYDAWARLSEYQGYVALLRAPGSQREAILNADPWRYYPRFGVDDPIYNIAAHLDTVGAGYRRNPRPAFNPQCITVADGIAVRVANAIEAGRAVDMAILEMKVQDADPAERARLAALQRLLDRYEGHGPTSREDDTASGDLAWEMECIRSDLLDPCFRGADDCRKWLTAQATGADPVDWLVAHRVFTRAWAAAGYQVDEAEVATEATGTPYAHAPLGEQWAHAFAALDEDPRYAFAVKLDTAWNPASVADIQAMMRAVVDANEIQLDQAEWPGILELGAGSLPLPPIAFYEATLAFAAVTRDALGNDLSDGWVSVTLGPLVGVDPLADRYFSEYAPNEPLMPGRTAWASSVNPMLRQWREALDAIFFTGTSTPGQLLEAWNRAWAGCTETPDRLLLARDAVAIGIVDGETAGTMFRLLVAQATPDDAVELALLAGFLGKGQADPAWLRIGLACLDEAAPGPWVAETIRAFARLADRLGGNPEELGLEQRLKGLAPRDRSIAEGRSAQWLRNWVRERWPDDPSLRASLAATVIVAATTEEIERVRAQESEERAIDPGWAHLVRILKASAEPEMLTTAIDRMIDLAPFRGLSLTETATEALELLSASHVATDAAAERLLPLIDAIPRTSVTWVRAQRQAGATPARAYNPFARALSDHATLWLAEIERGFSSSDLDALRRLIQVGDNRSAARVKLVFHGVQTWIGDNPHLHSLRGHPHGEGRETVERLAELAVECRTWDRDGWAPGRCLYQWYNDDPEVIRGWLDRLSADPGDPVIRRALFSPWRWSHDCLELCFDWIPTVGSMSLANTIAIWVGVTHLAVVEGREAATLPSLPRWPSDLLPDIVWLPRLEADALVLAAIADAAATADAGDDAHALSIRAEAAMQAHACSFRHGGEITADDYVSLGNAVTQYLGDVPESALQSMSTENWTEPQVVALTLWAKRSLERWYAQRDDSDQLDLYNDTLCISLLSILACLFDYWPNTLRAMLRERPGTASESPPLAPNWAQLLVEVILRFPNNRIPQAAWTLLAGVAGPDTQAVLIWKAFLGSIRSEPIVRDRALMTLLTVEGRALIAALAPKIGFALDEWESQTSGQTIRVLADLFAILAREPLLDAAVRRKIQARLRKIANRPSSRRPLFQMIGTGGKNEDAYHIIADGRLDARLREIERALLADVA